MGASAAAVVTSGAAAPPPAPKSQLSAAAEQVLLAFFSLQDSLSKNEARMLAQRVLYLNPLSYTGPYAAGQCLAYLAVS